jgi:hypothetical protein
MNTQSSFRINNTKPKSSFVSSSSGDDYSSDDDDMSDVTGCSMTNSSSIMNFGGGGSGVLSENSGLMFNDIDVDSTTKLNEYDALYYNNNEKQKKKTANPLPTRHELEKILLSLSESRTGNNNSDGFHDNGDEMLLRHQLATIRQIQTWNQQATHGVAAAAAAASGVDDDDDDNVKEEKKNKYLTDLAGLGAIRILLKFLEDHIKDPTSVTTTLNCLIDLLSSNNNNDDDDDSDSRSSNNSSNVNANAKYTDAAAVEEKKDDDDEGDDDEESRRSSKSNSTSICKTLIQMTIQYEGIEIMLRAFEIHATSMMTIGDQKTPSKSKHPKSLWKSISSTLSMAAMTTKSASTSTSSGELKTRSVGDNDYDYVSIGLSDLDLCFDETDQHVGDGIEFINSDSAITIAKTNNTTTSSSPVTTTKKDSEGLEDAVYTSPEAAIKVAEGLALLLPCCPSTAQASSILHFFIVMTPKLLRRQRDGIATVTTATVKSQHALLFLGIMSCLVAGTDVDGIEKSVDVKELVSTTGQIMKCYSHHAAVNIGGCILLQELGPLLTIKDRHECGVISVLGDLVMCMEMDMIDVKRVADTILTELS